MNYENYKKNDNIRLSDDKKQQTTPLNDDPSLEESLKSKKAPNDLASSDQSIENLLWFLAAIFLVYFTDICKVILYDQTIYRYYFTFREKF